MNPTEQPKKRIEWVDIAKGIGIVLVVVGHAPTGDMLRAYIYSFHMPLFFLVAGYTFKPDRFSTLAALAKSRVRPLLHPYFIFALLGYVVWFFVLSKFGEDRMESLTDKLLVFAHIFYSSFTKFTQGVQEVREPFMRFNGPIWFLTALFTTTLLFYLLNGWAKSRQTILLLLLVVSSLMGYVFSLYAGFRLPWGADIASVGVLFFGAGYLLARFKPFVDMGRLALAAGLLFTSLASVVIWHFNGSTGMAALKFGASFPLFLLGGLSGSLMVLFACRLIDTAPFLSYLGRNSLTILVLHLRFFFPLIKAVQIYALSIPLSLYTEQPAWGLLFAAVALLLCLPAIEIINRYLPFLIGKRAKPKASQA